MKNILSRISTGRLLVALLYAGAVILLAYAVSVAGYSYMFDNDEVSHAQIVYLLNLGHAPYRDFFSVYPPVFDAGLGAILSHTGFTFDWLFSARIVMIVLFWVRIIGASALAYLLFGAIPALLFIPLALVDPFTVFSGMQIRPDNLMQTFFIFALLTFTVGVRRKLPALILTSGALWALSFLTLPKILPSAAAVAALCVWILVRTKKTGLLGAWFSGALIVVFSYLLYFAAEGSLAEMLRQTLSDARATNNALLYPVKLGSFYYADNNVYLYGHPGKPLTWMYVWTIPLTGFAGLYLTLKRFVGKKTPDADDAVRLGLCASLILQWASLFFINSVFLQYYIPITWLFALFTAVLVTDWYAGISRMRILSATATVAGTLTISLLIHTQVTGNLNRATYDNTQNRRAFEAMWSIVGENEPSFPNALFRPLAYPFPYGYFYADIPRHILARYPDIDTVIEQQKLRVLLIDDYYMDKLPERYRTYILSRYERMAEPIQHYVRKK